MKKWLQTLMFLLVFSLLIVVWLQAQLHQTDPVYTTTADVNMTGEPNGSAAQLEDAVTIMTVYQLGRPLTASETEAIVKFLKSLSGEYKGKAL